MIAEITRTLLEFLKLAPRYLIALGCAAAFLLFASDGLLTRLGLIELVRSYRAVLGLILVVSVVLFGVSVIADAIKAFRRWQQKQKFHERMIARLESLTEDEKQILRFYFAEETRSNVLRLDDGVVQGLAGAGIIYRSTQLGNMLEGFAHNVSDFAWDYIRQHPELLQGTTNTYRTDKRDGLW